jgi:hypothetical protein
MHWLSRLKTKFGFLELLEVVIASAFKTSTCKSHARVSEIPPNR